MGAGYGLSAPDLRPGSSAVDCTHENYDCCLSSGSPDWLLRCVETTSGWPQVRMTIDVGALNWIVVAPVDAEGCKRRSTPGTRPVGRLTLTS